MAHPPRSPRRIQAAWLVLAPLLALACGGRSAEPSAAPPPAVVPPPASAPVTDPGAAPSAGPVMVGGGTLTRAEIQHVIRAHLPQLRNCYTSLLSTNPELEGRVVVRLTIGPSGDVADAVSAQSTFADPGLERCLLAAARRMVFPPPRGGGIVIVSYPFIFHADR